MTNGFAHIRVGFLVHDDLISNANSGLKAGWSRSIFIGTSRRLKRTFLWVIKLEQTGHTRAVHGYSKRLAYIIVT